MRKESKRDGKWRTKTFEQIQPSVDVDLDARSLLGQLGGRGPTRSVPSTNNHTSSLPRLLDDRLNSLLPIEHPLKLLHSVDHAEPEGRPFVSGKRFATPFERSQERHRRRVRLGLGKDAVLVFRAEAADAGEEFEELARLVDVGLAKPAQRWTQNGQG